MKYIGYKHVPYLIRESLILTLPLTPALSLRERVNKELSWE